MGWIIESASSGLGHASYSLYTVAFYSFFIGIVNYEKSFHSYFEHSAKGINEKNCKKELYKLIQIQIMIIK